MNVNPHGAADTPYCAALWKTGVTPTPRGKVFNWRGRRSSAAGRIEVIQVHATLDEGGAMPFPDDRGRLFQHLRYFLDLEVFGKFRDIHEHVGNFDFVRHMVFFSLNECAPTAVDSKSLTNNQPIKPWRKILEAGGCLAAFPRRGRKAGAPASPAHRIAAKFGIGT
jgi:hypothetical protein